MGDFVKDTLDRAKIEMAAPGHNILKELLPYIDEGQKQKLDKIMECSNMLEQDSILKYIRLVAHTMRSNLDNIAKSFQRIR